MILSFVGVKMLIVEFYKIPIGVSLGVIARLLAAAVVASLVRSNRIERQAQLEPAVSESR